MANTTLKGGVPQAGSTAMNTARWIAIAMLGPFWWGLAQLVLALLGDLIPGWRARVSRLFDRFEGREGGVEAGMS